jgi:trimeric autotransporter adhesin
MKKTKLLIALSFAGCIGYAQTTGYVPKWSGSAYVNTATPIFEDAVNLRIGIGTTTPGYKLDINGDANIPSGSAFRIGGNKILWYNSTNTNNLFVGVGAGTSTTASNNTFVGGSSGTSNTSGDFNTFLGFQSGNTNIGGEYNTFIGEEAGYSSTSNMNTFVGFSAGYTNGLGGTNTFIGSEAGYDNTSGSGNTFVGNEAGFFNGACNNNTFVGNNTGFNNSTGAPNSAFGSSALYSNTSGSNNDAYGFLALYTNSTGSKNAAFGDSALFKNTASDNSAFGYNALKANTSGSNNSALGYEALFANTTGAYNMATGMIALLHNTTGNYNTASGSYAMNTNTTGSNNVGVGHRAMNSNSTGDNNAGVGYYALYQTTASANTAIGEAAGYNNTSGTNNTFVGYQADLTASQTYTNCSSFGNGAIVNAKDKVRLGNTNVTVIEGTPAAYTSSSDGRFKFNVKEEVKGLEFIKKLRPVTYQWNSKQFTEFLVKNMDAETKEKHLKGVDFSASTKIIHTGFIAQEVEKAAKECGYNFDGVHAPNDENDNYSVAYSQFVMPLIKAVQEQQDMIEKQQKQIDELKQLVAAVTANSGSTAAISTQNISLSNAVVLNQNTPNPFAEQTVITYNVPQTFNTAQVLFYDAMGKLIKTVDVKTAGKGQLNVFANDLTSGIYSYTLVIDGKIIDTKKMMKQD